MEADYPAPWDSRPAEGHPFDVDAQDSPTWDVWHVDGDGQWLHLTETLAELQGALGWLGYPPADLFSELTTLIALPSWQGAPESLRAEVNAWLEANRQE